MTETRPVAAALLALTAMAVIGLIDNFVVVLAELGGLWQFHLMRTAMALPVLAALSFFGVLALRARRPWAVGIRSLLVSGAMMLYFGALSKLPIPQVAAGLFSAPIWILIVSALFLRRPVGPIRVGAAIVGFAGVLMVLRPDLSNLEVATIVPIVAGLLYGLGNLSTRELCDGESTGALLTGFFIALAFWAVLGLFAVAILQPDIPEGAAGFVFRGWEAPSTAFLYWTAIQAFGSLLAIGLLTRGYQLADAGFVSVFEYTFLGFAAFWAYMLRGETLDALSLLGIALIAVSGAVIALRGREA